MTNLLSTYSSLLFTTITKLHLLNAFVYFWFFKVLKLVLCRKWTSILSHGWYRWKTNTSQDIQRQLYLIEKVRTTLTMRTRTKAFRQWSSNTKQLKHERAITMKFVHRMRYLKVSQTMERWKDNVQDRKRSRYVLRSLSIKLRARNLSKGWYVCVQLYSAGAKCF